MKLIMLLLTGIGLILCMIAFIVLVIIFIINDIKEHKVKVENMKMDKQIEQYIEKLQNVYEKYNKLITTIIKSNDKNGNNWIMATYYSGIARTILTIVNDLKNIKDKGSVDFYLIDKLLESSLNNVVDKAVE